VLSVLLALLKLLRLLLVVAPRGFRVPLELTGRDRPQGAATVVRLRRVPGAPDVVPALVHRLLRYDQDPPARMEDRGTPDQEGHDRQEHRDERGHGHSEEAVPTITPNHVMWCASHQIGYGGGPPQPPQEPVLPTLPDSADGEPVVIAVLDGGVDERVPWFGSVPRVFRLDHGLDAPDPSPADGADLQAFTGHGTFVAGAALAEAYESVPETVRRRPVHILSVRITNADGYMSDEQSALGLRRLLDGVRSAEPGRRVARPDVLVTAWGGWVHDGTNPAMPLVDQAVRDLLGDPALAGTVIVASSGNEGFDGRLVYPASLPGEAVIGVGATTGARRPVRAGFSNAGPWVDACATGAFVLGAFLTVKDARVRDAYGIPPLGAADFAGAAVWSGTSMSAALVAGRLAREISTSTDPGLTGLQAWRNIVAASPGSASLPGIGVSLVVRPPVRAVPLRPIP
jgi:hypothetical protein